MIKRKDKTQNKGKSRLHTTVHKQLDQCSISKLSNYKYNHEKISILGNLSNAKIHRTQKLKKMQSKIFWNRNNRNQSTIQKIKQKSLEDRTNRQKSIDIFKHDKMKYQKIKRTKDKDKQQYTVFPIIRDCSQTQHLQTYKQQKMDTNKKITNQQVNHSKYANILEMSLAQQSSLLQKIYKARCKKQNDIFRFNFFISQRQEVQQRQNKVTHIPNSLQQDKYVPNKFIKSLKHHKIL